jgi:hypothetical protein
MLFDNSSTSEAWLQNGNTLRKFGHGRAVWMPKQDLVVESTGSRFRFFNTISLAS